MSLRPPFWALVDGVWHLYDNALGQKVPEPNCSFAPKEPPADAPTQQGLTTVFLNPMGRASCRACWIGAPQP